MAQELALLATKADVREELDRLAAHIAASRALMAESAPVGRRLISLSGAEPRSQHPVFQSALIWSSPALGSN